MKVYIIRAHYIDQIIIGKVFSSRVLAEEFIINKGQKPPECYEILEREVE